MEGLEKRNEEQLTEEEKKEFEEALTLLEEAVKCYFEALEQILNDWSEQIKKEMEK